MAVFRWKGVKVITDAAEVSDVIERLGPAYSALQFLKIKDAQSPVKDAVYTRANPALGWRVVLQGNRQEINITKEPMVEIPKPTIYRPQQVPYYKFLPAIIVADEDNKLIGAVLCMGEGFEPPFKFLELDVQKLYPFYYGEWMWWSRFFNGPANGDFTGYSALYDYKPPGEAFEKWEQGEINMLPTRVAIRSVDEQPATAYTWEIPSMHQYAVWTDYIPSDETIVVNWAGCEVYKWYDWSCHAAMATPMWPGHYERWQTWNGSWQIREKAFPAWPCGEEVGASSAVIMERGVNQQLLSGGASWWCGCDSCCKCEEQCAESQAWVELQGELACKQGDPGFAYNKGRWLPGYPFFMQGDWLTVKSMTWELDIQATYIEILEPYGSTLLNGEEGAYLFMEYNRFFNETESKGFSSYPYECGGEAEFHCHPCMNGIRQIKEGEMIYTDGEETIWLDGKRYPTGRLFKGGGGAPTFVGGRPYMRYYQLFDNPLLMMSRELDDNYCYTFLYPDADIQQFDYTIPMEDNKAPIPGLKYKGGDVFATLQFTLLKYAYLGLQPIYKEPF